MWGNQDLCADRFPAPLSPNVGVFPDAFPQVDDETLDLSLSGRAVAGGMDVSERGYGAV